MKQEVARSRVTKRKRSGKECKLMLTELREVEQGDEIHSGSSPITLRFKRSVGA